MLRFSTHDMLSCTPERFWKLHFDSAFVRSMVLEGLGFTACEVGELKKSGPITRRETFMVPKLQLPASAAKVLGPKFGVTEVGEFDEGTGQWTFVNRLSVLSGRVRLGGTMRIVGKDGQSERIVDHWVDVDVIGVGKLIERAAEKSTRDGWSQGAAWFNRWLAEHPEGDAAASSG
jgi:hypothetical protein